MNKRLLLTASALIITAVAICQTVKIKGSDTTLPLTEKEIEAYIKTFKSSSVAVTGGGSGVGIASLAQGTIDIAMSSRPLKFEEKMRLKAAKIEYRQVEVAKDALSIIVHPSNRVTQLTRQQLEDIFTGKITNWKQVGGDDMRIIVYTRETSSGTYDFFKDHVMTRKNYARTALSMAATGAIIQSISQTKGAIGYVGIAYLEPKVKALAVSFDGKTYVKPTPENVVNGKYPITRPLYFLYNVNAEKKVRPFISFILSVKGQQEVKKDGYIPIK